MHKGTHDDFVGEPNIWSHDVFGVAQEKNEMNLYLVQISSEERERDKP